MISLQCLRGPAAKGNNPPLGNHPSVGVPLLSVECQGCILHGRNIYEVNNMLIASLPPSTSEKKVLELKKQNAELEKLRYVLPTRPPFEFSCSDFFFDSISI